MPKVSAKRAAQKAVTADKSRRKKLTKDSFQNFAAGLGIGVDPQTSAAFYGFNPITRDRIQLEWIHRGSWLGALAVDIPADDMTREGFDITGELNPDDAQNIVAYLNRLDFLRELADAVRWSRLYGGAIAVHLLDGQDPSTPLRMDTIRKNQYKGLLVLDRWMVEPSLNDLVTAFGPRLGEPKFYRVIEDAPAMRTQQIHYSRVIRLEGDRMPYYQRLTENLWGVSVLERLYDRMVAFDEGTTGASQLLLKAFLRTYKIEDLRQIVGTNDSAFQGLLRQLAFMRQTQTNEGITLMDKTDEFETHQSVTFTGISDILIQFGQQIGGSLGMPLVRLFGQSPVGMNSTGESDLKMYYDGLRQKQGRYLTPGVIVGVKCAAASCGVELPKDTGVNWKPLWQMSHQEKATVAQTIATTMTALLQENVLPERNVLQELARVSEDTGIFASITSEQIDAAAESVPPAALPEAGQGESGLEPTDASGERREAVPARGAQELRGEEFYAPPAVVSGGAGHGTREPS